MNRVFQLVVASIVAFPMVMIVLAWVFQSDALGWLFGLGLVAAALLPCVALAWVGAQWLPPGRRARARATVEAALPKITVQVERDTVHASDEPSMRQVAVSPATTVRAWIEQVLADDPLPSIAGGRATWIVEASQGAAGLAPIAVCAQEWIEPAFLLPPHTPVAEQLGTSPARLFFRYRCQDDPAAVFRSLMERVGRT